MGRIWFPLYDTVSFEQLMSFIEVNMLKHLGIRIMGMSPDSLTANMPVDHRTQQPLGLLHGGASCVLAESLGSTASYLCIDPDKYNVVGLEINANHIRSVKQGLVTGTCTPVHLGRSSHIWDIRILDEEDRLVCASRMTNAILDKERGHV
ncbi:MAG: hotdog fold thioesterase [Proteobacteria bacterium]|nr:hotdog fold thioesterase [Pseudomonadota bacterium]